MPRNNFEEQTFNRLKFLKTKGIKVKYEGEYLSYTLTKKYLPDFVVTFQDGSKIYIETKGYLRTNDIIKLKAVKTTNPDIDLRIVFQQDKKVYKKSKMYYSDWAEKYGFPYAIGKVPTEWLKRD